MTDRVTFPSTAGEAEGVLFLPAGGAKGAGVVLIHEWWGVNQQIQTVAQRWADAGFVMKALDFGKAVQEIAGAVKHLKSLDQCTARVAVSGYCMGGALTLASA